MRELKAICCNSELFCSIFEAGSKLQEKEMDFTLSFLDGFVLQALQNGAEPYQANYLRDSDVNRHGAQSDTGSLKFESRDTMTSEQSSLSQSATRMKADDDAHDVELNVKRSVWSKDGYSGGADEKATAEVTSSLTEAAGSKEDEERAALAIALFDGVDQLEGTEAMTSLNLDLHDTDSVAMTVHKTAESPPTSDQSLVAMAFQPELGNYVNDRFADDEALPDTDRKWDLDLEFQSKQDGGSSCDVFHHHQYANLRDNFEVDSLDGSPDKELTPSSFKVDQSNDS